MAKSDEAKSLQSRLAVGFSDTKPHLELLDALRGAAALMVVWYHVFEGFAFAEAVNGVGDGSIMVFNHGYLAVDFFFMLSGFVISYAYDDRWGTMSVWQFFKRRLVRLHPMVVMGALVGLAAFCIGGCCGWNGQVFAFKHVLLAFVLAVLLVPMPQGAVCDVRGNGEMFPLNGPAWSLFFEYVGNVLYALVLWRLSSKVLAWLVVLLGVAFAGFAVTNVSGYGSIGVGWTLNAVNFGGGLLRMLFPFSLGMLLRRTCRSVAMRHAFAVCTLLLFALFSVPFLGTGASFSLNGVYEVFCVVCVFPLIVLVAAGSHTEGKSEERLGRFLGEMSYPLYIVHYPVMYLFYAWLIADGVYALGAAGFAVLGVLGVSLLLAYFCVKFYDNPLRRWLVRRLNHTRSL